MSVFVYGLLCCLRAVYVIAVVVGVIIICCWAPVAPSTRLAGARSLWGVGRAHFSGGRRGSELRAPDRATYNYYLSIYIYIYIYTHYYYYYIVCWLSRGILA